MEYVVGVWYNTSRLFLGVVDMAKPYSIDLRMRVILKYNEGKTVEEIAIDLCVKKSFIYNMIALYKETGSVAPKPHTGGRKPTIDEEMLEQIKVLILDYPDITLQEIKDELGLSISISIICDAINKRLNLRRKKKLFFPKDRIMMMFWKLVKRGKSIKKKWIVPALYSSMRQALT